MEYNFSGVVRRFRKIVNVLVEAEGPKEKFEE